MNNALKMFVCVLVLGSLTACYDDSGPAAVIETSAGYLMKDKDNAFRSLLIGEAKEQLADSAELQGLKNLVKSYKKLEIVKVEKTQEAKISKDETHRSYDVLVLGDGVELLTVGVKCVESYGYFGKVPAEILMPLKAEGISGAVSDVPRRQWHSHCRVNTVSKLN